MTQIFAAYNLTWGIPAVGLDSNPPIGDTDNNAAIAMDVMGNAAATWSRTKGMAASENVWATSYNHASRVWTGALKISGSGSAANSQVAIDPNSNALFVWEEGFPTQVLFRMLSKEGVWSPDLSMEPDPIETSIYPQTLPQIALDKEGNALAIWLEWIDGQSQLHSAKKSVGGFWQGLGQISSGNSKVRIIPAKALAVNEMGTGVAVWEEGSEIHAAQFIGGSWTAAVLVSTAGEHPTAGIDATGKAMIAWSQEKKIMSRSFFNGQLSDQTLVASNPAYSAKRPHIGVDAEGNAVVVFERYNSIHKFIAAATLSKTADHWAEALDISAPSDINAEAAGYPILAMNPIGDGVVIWKEWAGTHKVIQGAGYSLNTWSFVKTLSSLNADSGAPSPAYDISVAINHAGNIFAIWPEDPTGTGAQQIKVTTGVGLPNVGPMPPVADPITVISGVVSGKQIIHRFPAHADLINILTWTCSEDVDYFKIYRGSLSSLIGTAKERRFEDHQREPKKQETYLITAIDRHGQESAPMTIVVNPR